MGRVRRRVGECVAPFGEQSPLLLSYSGIFLLAIVELEVGKIVIYYSSSEVTAAMNIAGSKLRMMDGDGNEGGR